ncbi:hypothetical protein DdX_03975 [Ditylenchus destructor]|uniref:Regulatory protein zeste n=1 Tax=Ditylenchus destructor TaxID=166010 RepID=A0AAD4NCZ5_9BILA|nr:hypothetical protein DdX_03975 [Ditylenchus destructor]
MSNSIMRPEQTVRLIQLYHAHYPEIARNTQDHEGRKDRVVKWNRISEDLNAQFGTNFTVEQFKKKVQNVQCTSRQKTSSGKKNLGEAEREYMILFPDKNMSGCSGSNPDLDAERSQSVGSISHNDGESKCNELHSDVKLEHTFVEIESHNNAPDDNYDGQHNASEVTSNPLATLSNDQITQTLSTFLGLVGVGNVSNKDQNSDMFQSNPSQNTRNSTKRNTEPTLNNFSNMWAAKRRRKQAQTVHLNDRLGTLSGQGSSLTPETASSFSMDQDLLNGFSLDNGHDEPDEKWRVEIVSMQRTILDNQRRILELMERQANLDHRPVSQTPPSIMTPPSPIAPNMSLMNTTNAMKPTPSAQTDEQSSMSSNNALQILCTKIDSLAQVLSSIDKSIQERFPAISPPESSDSK